ncbi:MAG: ABC transporter ATP-binding protein [Epsilonproteobacteria bacterium]|nr:ABC transporter ATP-binding protein [Campylobacterota bacterium]
MVKIRDAVKNFGEGNVLDHVSIDIEEGDKIAMLGPNGAGKTTLVRAILGYYRLNEGTIEVGGMDPIKDRTKILKKISFIPQLPPPIKISIKDLINYICVTSGVDEKIIIKEAEDMELDIQANMNKPFFKLSGGMKQKLLIAIALARKSELYIFDEPTANLDPKGRENFYHLLKGLDPKSSVIYITHRLEDLEGLINRMIYLDIGKVTDDKKI